jgi:hypothetical protein
VAFAATLPSGDALAISGDLVKATWMPIRPPKRRAAPMAPRHPSVLADDHCSDHRSRRCRVSITAGGQLVSTKVLASRGATRQGTASGGASQKLAAKAHRKQNARVDHLQGDATIARRRRTASSPTINSKRLVRSASRAAIGINIAETNAKVSTVMQPEPRLLSRGGRRSVKLKPTPMPMCAPDAARPRPR